eukprot:gene8060-1296_t
MASPSASPPGTSSGQEGEECLVLEPSNTARERESVVVNFDMDAQRRLVAQQCEISRKRVAAMLAGEEASQAAAKRARRFASSSLGRDVFIVDQHAADEKYNFERLQRIAQPTRQPLLCPKSLGLTPLDDMIIKDNIDTFRRNGFDFVEDESTGALLLSAVPCSKRTFTFGADDCMEMVAMLKAGERPEDIRPTKVRAMFASRACRTSIMIGKALEVSQMYRVLEHLSGLVAPWNCPHGRPTMRHVASAACSSNVLARPRYWNRMANSEMDKQRLVRNQSYWNQVAHQKEEEEKEKERPVRQQSYAVLGLQQ